MNEQIPFNLATAEGKELEYIADAMARGHIAGAGPYTLRCQRLLESLLGSEKVLLTSSCTHALEMAALLLEIKPGDEVILPSFTFVSTANAFALRGARPVFIDIRADTLNLDERLLESCITDRTRAIVPVHYAGVGCEMDPIMSIAAKHGVTVVEDNAHGLFGEYRGRQLGTFGALATQSFHETKNITCGEGGALLINDPQYVERAEILREKGTNRARFFRGQVDRYTWVDVGSSYVPSDMSAAFLYAQLLLSNQIQLKRKRVWNFYYEALHDWAFENGARLPVVPQDRAQAYHMFYLLLPTLELRQELIAHLKSRGVHSVFHYQPLHLSEMGERYGGCQGQCPVTEYISDRLLRLPFYKDISEAQLEQVVQAVMEFRIRDAGRLSSDYDAVPGADLLTGVKGGG